MFVIIEPHHDCLLLARGWGCHGGSGDISDHAECGNGRDVQREQLLDDLQQRDADGESGAVVDHGQHEFVKLIRVQAQPLALSFLVQRLRHKIRRHALKVDVARVSTGLFGSAPYARLFVATGTLGNSAIPPGVTPKWDGFLALDAVQHRVVG